MLRSAAHETYHFVENYSAKDAADLNDYVLEALKKNGVDIEKALEKYAKQGYATRDEQISELVADSMFDVFSNEDFIKDLTAKNQTLAKRLANHIGELVNKIREAVKMLSVRYSNPEIKALMDDAEKLDTIRNMLLEGYKNAGENFKAEQAEVQKNNAEGTAVKYSIHSDSQGDYVKVDVDQNIFDNKNVREMQSIARKIINQKYKGKVLNVGVKGKAFVNKRSADEYAYPANRRMDDVIKEAKMRSSTELDNLLAISKFINNEPDDGRHPDATGGWDIYETRFEVANIMFAGEIKIKVTDRGFVFYDITQIRRLPVNGNQTKINSAVASGNLPNNSIPKTIKSVKQNFSMKQETEENRELIAVHNIYFDKMMNALKLGGFPMPSIAVTKSKSGHEKYGPISVVFNKSTIDPAVSKDNKIYGGDAWTPTYPTIEYKVNEKVQDKISKVYYEIYEKYGGDEARPLYNFVYDLERQLNSKHGESGLIESLMDDEKLMQLYLLHSGKGKIEPIMKQALTELSESDVEMYDYFVSSLGRDVIEEIKVPTGVKPLDHRRDYFNKHGEKIENAYRNMLKDKFNFNNDEIENVMENMRKYDLVNLVKKTYNYLKNGRTTVTEETDSKATSEAIRNAIKNSEYKQWINNLFKGVEEKSGIRNNADYFTSTGNRRSWDALHWENTLENVVKVMKSQNNGDVAFFSGHAIWGVAAKDYKSIEDMKKDSGRLKTMPEEDYNVIKEEFGERLTDIAKNIMDKRESNQFIAIDNAMECIVDSVRKGKTKAGLFKELKKYTQLEVTENDVDEIISLVADISNMPTEYFEAKPERAVGFDEIEFVVIPDDTPAELIEGFEENGIEMRTYSAGDEQSRLEALNSKPEVLFSRKQTDPIQAHYAEVMRENRNLKNIISALDEMQYSSARSNIHLDGRDIHNIAGRLLKSASSKYELKAFEDELTAVYDYMANGGEVDTEAVFQTYRG